MKKTILLIGLCAIVLAGCGKAETAPTTDQAAQATQQDQTVHNEHLLNPPDRPMPAMTGKHKY